MHWKFDENFPPAPGDAWSAWRPPFGRKRMGESAVRRATWQWHPLDPLLVSVPGARHMLPPVCFTEIAQALHRKMLLQYRALLLLVLCILVGSGVAGYATGDGFFLKASLAVAVLLVFVLLQYFCVLVLLERVREYSRLFSWCYLQPQAPVVWMAALMVLAGSAQYLAQSRIGDLSRVIETYGLVFNRVPQDPWRYLTGPFLHAGLAHWIANFSLLMVGSGFAFAFGKNAVLWSVFAAGVFLPGIALTFLPHWIGLDAFLGVSGGVFALLGWVVGITLRNRQVFPAGLWWVMGYFSLATVLVASLLDAHASWFAHLFGFFIGLLLGMAEIGMKFELGISRKVVRSSDEA
ncbi:MULTISPECIES: rhomboid family intramembrane serine protease [Xanthomonas]|nr:MULTISPECIES: rhomboid family intramembrane serine protease [Xanthomonas]UZA98883.1 rhomboid family intramembrane serine protease [Xanthomonas citri pv. fuscans]UZB04662.1 rhomboid family intramembrane serine protease [Xanthomonas citri pv. fuscans]UZB07332.1 rhomboid family intramembrane serine protease [Xanthomonas citri pv. fuscans]